MKRLWRKPLTFALSLRHRREENSLMLVDLTTIILTTITHSIKHYHNGQQQKTPGSRNEGVRRNTRHGQVCRCKFPTRNCGHREASQQNRSGFCLDSHPWSWRGGWCCQHLDDVCAHQQESGHFSGRQHLENHWCWRGYELGFGCCGEHRGKCTEIHSWHWQFGGCGFDEWHALRRDTGFWLGLSDGTFLYVAKQGQEL